MSINTSSRSRTLYFAQRRISLTLFECGMRCSNYFARISWHSIHRYWTLETNGFAKIPDSLSTVHYLTTCKLHPTRSGTMRLVPFYAHFSVCFDKVRLRPSTHSNRAAATAATVGNWVCHQVWISAPVAIN
jgi:hypothetical protein